MTDAQTFLDGRVTLHSGDCREVIRSLADCSIDSVVCDPPYALVSIAKRFGKPGSAEAKGGVYQRSAAGFMGKTWDNGEAAFAAEFWAEVLRVLKPGGHVLAFSGTRTYHRLAVAVEDAGFEIRDQIGWAYGSGFPKSHDVSKGIDKKLGREREKIRIDAADLKNPPNLVGGAVKGDDRPWRLAALERGFHEAVSDEAVSDEAVSDEAVEWDGWGTALKPAWEPIVMARKPLGGTVAANVLEHGTGALNIDGCRVPTDGETITAGLSDPANRSGVVGSDLGISRADKAKFQAAQVASIERANSMGRWPANIIHDGSAEVVSAFPDSAGQQGDVRGSEPSGVTNGIYGEFAGRVASAARGDDGSAARFFYTAKADADDRLGSKHPTVKPVSLIRYLARLVTPPGGTILDPFAGTGTLGEAAFYEGFKAILIEREEEYQRDIARRMELVLAGPDQRRRESLKAGGKADYDAGPLFEKAGA